MPGIPDCTVSRGLGTRCTLWLESPGWCGESLTRTRTRTRTRYTRTHTTPAHTHARAHKYRHYHLADISNMIHRLWRGTSRCSENTHPKSYTSPVKTEVFYAYAGDPPRFARGRGRDVLLSFADTWEYQPTEYGRPTSLRSGTGGELYLPGIRRGGSLPLRFLEYRRDGALSSPSLDTTEWVDPW